MNFVNLAAAYQDIILVLAGVGTLVVTLASTVRALAALSNLSIKLAAYTATKLDDEFFAKASVFCVSLAKKLDGVASFLAELPKKVHGR